MLRKLFPMLAVAIAFAGFTLATEAAEVKTITGEAQCGKCALREDPKCNNVIVTEENGKKVKYYMEMDEFGRANHGKIFCQAPKDAGPTVKVTGEVSEKDGRKMIKATKIEEIED